MEIVKVDNKRLLKKFIELPYKLYKDNSNWIAPLKIDQKAIFNPKKNTTLANCEHQLFLLFRDKKAIARIAVFIDKKANDYWQKKIGFFGHYECIQNQEAASLLLKKAEDWLKKRSMEQIWAPWNLVAQDMGFILEGFEVPPIILSSYNFPYYNEQMTEYGFKKVKDLLVYYCDTREGYKLPDRFIKNCDKLAKRFGVTVRSIDIKNFNKDVKLIVRLLNDSLADNWGYCPVAEAEAEQIAKDLKLIVHPEVVLIAECRGKPIGYMLVLPDINAILKNLKGRLFPFGIFKLLFGIKKINRYRIWALGIAKSFHNRGLSILLFQRLYEILKKRNVYVEANWILEDNFLMNNALKQLEFKLIKKYRIYEKQI